MTPSIDLTFLRSALFVPLADERFLASDDAAFITGQVLSVSGGLTMAG